MRLNEAGEKLVGHPRAEIIGKSDYDLFPREEADFFVQKDRSVLEGAKMIEISEEPLHTRHGVRILHTKKVPLNGPDGKPQFLLGISEDITARKQAEQRLARMTEALQRSNKELEQFAYIASHDLQEPLRKVEGFGEMLQDHIGPQLDEEGHDYLMRMIATAQRMRDLIDGLLTYSRVTTKASPFVSVDLNEVAEEVLADLELRIRDTGGEVEVHDLPTVVADRLQMRQLLQNLVGNGLKFHRPDHPPHVTIRGETIEPAPKERPPSAEHRCYRLFVEDNGIGIEPQYVDQLFVPFRRLHGRGSPYKGTGIGLAICRKIVERHDGTITIQSTPGKGTTFIVTLPCHSEGTQNPEDSS